MVSDEIVLAVEEVYAELEKHLEKIIACTFAMHAATRLE